MPASSRPPPRARTSAVFVLAKCCRTESSGGVSLELSVDCSQHPSLTVREEAVAALRGVLVVPSSAGPVALDTLGPAVIEDATEPDPTLPVPPDPQEAGRARSLVKLRYSWHPGTPSVRFAVPSGNPHDVLFWLDGAARPAGAPAPWQILIAGDISPPVPIPASAPVSPSPRPVPAGRQLGLAAAILLGLAAIIRWHRAAS